MRLIKMLAYISFSLDDSYSDDLLSIYCTNLRTSLLLFEAGSSHMLYVSAY